MTVDLVGVVLAGGRARRMGGGDKCLLPLAGRTLLDHVVARARPQVDRLILNAAGDPGRFAGFGLPVVPDSFPGYAGPLAGILAGLEWAAAHFPKSLGIVSFAADTPFVPEDLAARLLGRARQCRAEIAVAESHGRRHPLAAFWSLSLRDALRANLVEGARKAEAWQAGRRCAACPFPAAAFDPFFNVNEPRDLEEAGRLLKETCGPQRPSTL